MEIYIFYDTWEANSFAKIMNGRSSSYLPHVLQSIYYRDKFLTIVSDLFNTSYSTNSVLDLVDKEYEKIRPETVTRYGKDYAINSDMYIELMKLAISERKSEMNADIQNFLGLDKVYRIEIQNAEGLNILWNQMALYSEERYENEYYCGTSFQVEALPYPGYAFDYWLVNGQRVDGGTLNISETLSQNYSIKIKAISRRIDEGQLVISEVSSKGANDWVKLRREK